MVVSPALLVLALTLQGADAPHADAQRAGRVRDGLLIGAAGLLVTGGYTAGAFLAQDQPAGHALAVVGGSVALGAVGASVAMLLLSWRDNPWGLVPWALVTVGAGLAGAVLGGVLAHVGAENSGATRTATHGVVVGLCLTETVLIELSRLVR